MSTQELSLITSAQSVPTTTETVIATSNAIQYGPGQQGAWISGDIRITPGAAATAVTIRCRYTSLAGNNVDSSTVVPVTAAVATDIPYNFFDTSTIPEAPGGSVYVITVQQTAATGNGTVNGGHLGIEV